MSSLAIYVIVLFVVAVIVVFVSIFAYNKRLDKVTSGEIRDTHSSIPEPGTTVGTIYKIILMVLIVIMFFAVSTINGKLTAVQNDIDQMQLDISSLSTRVYDLEQKLTEGQKHTAYTGWEILEPDYTNRTAEVEFYASLKEYAENAEVILNLNGKEVSLTQDGDGVFRGRFTANFFEEYAHPLLCINEGGRIITEEVDFPQYIFWDFIPMPSLECKFDSDVSASGKLKYEGWYRIVLDNPDEIESAEVAYCTGGREIKRMDVTKEVLNRTEITLDKDLDLDKDLTLQIELVTKNGFRVVDRMVVIYDTSWEYEEMDSLKILDLKGNTVWEDPYR